MISENIKYHDVEIEEPIFQAGGLTLLTFSRLNKFVKLNGSQIETACLILDLLQERAEEEMEDHYMNDDDSDELLERKEMLYGTLVDCFEGESFYSNEDDHDVPPRNLTVYNLPELPNEKYVSDETLLKFGYVNSRDLYIEPSDLKILSDDLKWFTEESGRAKDETKELVNSLIVMIDEELTMIANGAPHNKLYVEESYID